jgi:nucleotide-binding universal stress UspA family protein
MGEAMGASVAPPISEADVAAYSSGVLEAALSGLDVGAVAVELRPIQGDAAKVLQLASEGAELLVVGVGHSELGGRLVGSVGTHCAHHAACPVVLVRVTEGG